MQRKFLFGLRKLMIEWDWTPFELWVDTNDYSLAINDFKIVHVRSNEQVFEIDWVDDWQTRFDDPKVHALTNEVRLKLATYKKGKGKGKPNE